MRIDDTLEMLFDAVCWVESRNNPDAVNESEDAVGIAQIRPGVVEDCQRLSPASRFTLDSRKSIGGSWLLFRCYLKYWGTSYARETERQPDHITLARIWNGGPRGWNKDATMEYAAKIQARLDEQRVVEAGLKDAAIKWKKDFPR